VPAPASNLPRRLAPPSPPAVDRAWVPRLHPPRWALARGWLVRLVVITIALALLGIALPLLAPVDRAVFEAINGLGYGPGWVFELLDPHERLYRGLLLLAIIVAVALRGPWVAVGVAAALMAAATLSYLLLEVIALPTNRSRPQALLETILKPPGADWAQASYPSGHVTVTTAMASAAALVLPVLRWPMAIVTVVIAWSRMAFGAHFPLDVLAGALLGYAGAAFSVALFAALGLLPRAEPAAQRERSSTAASVATSSRPPSTGASRSSGTSART
jgi:membrane-associated phospholipid phosphatase